MRTVLSLVFLVAVLWASCTIKLGAFTLSEHVDRIGETDQAQELLDGTRGRISPVLEDMKQRIFGEYVEAPTRLPDTAAEPKTRPKGPSRPPQAQQAAKAPTPSEPGRAPSRARAQQAAKAPTPAPDSAPGRAPSSAKAARRPGDARPARRLVTANRATARDREPSDGS